MTSTRSFDTLMPVPLRNRAHVTPLVDTNSLLAIESLFAKGPSDPWAINLASTFADLFAYADSFRFTFGSPQGAISAADWANTPALVQYVRRRDSAAVVPLVVPTNEPVQLHDDYLADAFHGFAVLARNNHTQQGHPRTRAWRRR